MMNQYGLVASVAIALIAGVVRIVGGEDAAPGEFPYQVSVRWNCEHVCSGSIISGRHVLTTKGCTFNPNDRNSRLTVVTGSINNIDGLIHLVESIHPITGPNTLTHDIAIIKLKNAIQLTDNQKVVALPNGNVPVGLTASVTGWLHITATGPLHNENLRKFTATITGLNSPYENSIYATGVPRDRTERLDDGSPMVRNGQLIGIALASYYHAENSPTAYHSVHYYINEIRVILSQT